MNPLFGSNPICLFSKHWIIAGMQSLISSRDDQVTLSFQKAGDLSIEIKEFWVFFKELHYVCMELPARFWRKNQGFGAKIINARKRHLLPLVVFGLGPRNSTMCSLRDWKENHDIYPACFKSSRLSSLIDLISLLFRSAIELVLKSLHDWDCKVCGTGCTLLSMQRSAQAPGQLLTTFCSLHQLKCSCS